MVLSTYAKQRVIFYHQRGYKAPTIAQLLREEGIIVTRVGVYKFLIRYRDTGTLQRKEGSGPPRKITTEVREVVEQEMQRDDETTAYQLHKILTDKEILISKSTIIRCRTELGWTFRSSAYCQLIREANKGKRLQWAQQYRSEAESGFKNVVWTDESSIQMETHKRFCYRKLNQPAKSKPRFVIVLKHCN